MTTGVSNTKGFAIDWISGNMYFTSHDDNFASISVAKLDGAFRTMLRHKDIRQKRDTNSWLNQPNSLAVHPIRG